MDNAGVKQAIAAAQSLAEESGLAVEQVKVIHNSNKLALRLLPCDVFARVARAGEEVAELEVSLARQLAVVDAPVANLDPRFGPRVFHRDGFAITWWTFYETITAASDSSWHRDQAGGLTRFHAGLRTVDVDTPHFLDRVKEAEVLISDRALTPALDDAGRQLLLDTFESVRHSIRSSGAQEQLLHGEPHPLNVLNTSSGPRFIDLETCCRGPVEFDAAHVPTEVSKHLPGLDQDLLSECRRLVLAMVAAWRWDKDDEFPDGLRHGRTILDRLGAGPPWPVLGALSSD